MKKLKRILTCFHKKPWLPKKEKSVPAYTRGKKMTILTCCKASKNCKIKLACVGKSGRKKQHCACKIIAPIVPPHYQHQ
jgi:hypothetical protein